MKSLCIYGFSVRDDSSFFKCSMLVFFWLINVHMSVLVGANIYLAVLLNEPEKKKIIELTQDSVLVSPLVLPFEIGNALSAMYRCNKLRSDQVQECFSIFNNIPIRLVDVDIYKALEIAADFNIYAYDAYYIEIAKRYKFSLLSLDKKMISVATELGIHTMEVTV